MPPDQFAPVLQLLSAPAPYNVVSFYGDGYMYWTILGYAHRVQPASAPMVFCSHEYDVKTGSYLREIASLFPGDLVARAYASVLQIADLPFLSWPAPLPN